MKDQFIPYELAVKLKELGFDEECIYFYEDNGRFNTHGIFEFFSGSATKAPLWQQAFDWFEDKHKLYSSQDNVILDYSIIDCRNNDIQVVKATSIDSTYKNREEVREARLGKLIKLIS